jgi:hypothetical protein
MTKIPKISELFIYCQTNQKQNNHFRFFSASILSQ